MSPLEKVPVSLHHLLHVVIAQPVGDEEDHAQPLASQGIDDAVADTLRERLDMLDRALKRLDDGTYGRSIRSGQRCAAASGSVQPQRRAERELLVSDNDRFERQATVLLHDA